MKELCISITTYHQLQLNHQHHIRRTVDKQPTFSTTRKDRELRHNSTSPNSRIYTDSAPIRDFFVRYTEEQ